MKQQISQRDQTRRQAILEHTARYRLTVSEALARQPALHNLSRKELRRLLVSLCREGQLGEACLYHNRRYYFLPARGNDAELGPLSELAKLRAYALLSFCCLGKVHRKRLTRVAIEQHLPDLHRPGLPEGYYVAAGEPPRFGLALIDAGGRGRWDRVLGRVRSQLEDHWRHPALRTFIEQGRFEITILTLLPQKAGRLAAALTEWGDPRTQFIRIAVLPELIHLIAPPPLQRH